MLRMAVDSTSLEAVGYEDETMEVRFRNGGVYRYFDVPPEVCIRLLRAESKGRFFNEEIRGAYRCRRIKAGFPAPLSGPTSS